MNNKKRQENIQRLLEGKQKKHIDHGENIPTWFYVLFIVLAGLLVRTSADGSTLIETEIVELAKIDFPHWGKCEASTVSTKALMVVTITCDNKTATTTIIRSAT